MSATEQDLSKIAASHGVAFTDVKPRSKQDRGEKLKEILTRTDVPYPIDPDRAQAYLQAFENDEPFGVGTLSDQTVDLGEYLNFQTFDKYTLDCLLYTSPSPRDLSTSRMPSSA